LNMGYLALSLKFNWCIPIFFKELWRNPYLSLGKCLFDCIFRNASEGKGGYEHPSINNYPIFTFLRRLFSSPF